MYAADMPKNALSVLLTAVQPDNFRPVKRQKITDPPEIFDSHIHEARAGLSNDPSEVCAWVPKNSLGMVGWHMRSPDAARGCFRVRSFTLQAANLLRKQFHIHVKGRNVPCPLQVCACVTLWMPSNDRLCSAVDPSCHFSTAPISATANLRRIFRLCGRMGSCMRGCSRT